MPFTFSHPAAIAPFIKRTEKLSVSAMVMGSIVPDLEFYFKMRLGENIGHTFKGIFFFDFPVALLCFFVFHSLVKTPIFRFSPWFIQNRIPLVTLQTKNHLSLAGLLRLMLSISIGLTTHLFLDSMTHAHGWMVTQFSGLASDLWIWGKAFPIYYILQLGLSLLGLIWLIILFYRLPTYPPLRFNKSRFPFWGLTSIGFILGILVRTYFFPEFISFWDAFMMLVGAGLYGILLSSMVFKIFDRSDSRNHRKFDKLINSGGIDPVFKTRTLSVKENQSSTLPSKGVVEMDDLINEPQVIVSQSGDIQINKGIITSENFIKIVPQVISSTSFSFSSQNQLKSRAIDACRLKFVAFYFHVIYSFKKYINMNKLMCIILFIFSMAPVTMALQNGDTLNPDQREELIQKAIQLRSEERFGDAIAELEKILLVNPKDAQILLFKGDLCLQNKDFNRAVETYDALLPLDYEITTARINKSYALFMAKKPAKALQVASEAWQADSLHQGAIVNHFNAMLWNSKSKTASDYLDKQSDKLNRDQFLVMKGRLATNSGDFRNGLSYYDSLVQAFPVSHYILEYGEVLIGKKRWKEAQELLEEKGSELSDSQKGRLESLLRQANLQTAGVQVGYFEDIAGNIRLEQSLFWANESNKSLNVGFQVGASQVFSEEDQKTNLSFISGNAEYKWSNTIESKGELRLQQISPQDGSSFRAVTGRFMTNYQPNDRRMVGLFYQSDILNFTADLLDKNIRSQDLGYVTHIMLDGRTGIFSQGSLGAFNDKNSRLQFFGSLYRVLRTEPTLKTGVNFSGLTFSMPETTLYFAPDRFLSTELFLDYSTPMPLVSKVAVQLQLATGLQKIEETPWDSTYRGQVTINYNISGFNLALNGLISNVAASSGTGYRFHYLTFRVSKKF